MDTSSVIAISSDTSKTSHSGQCVCDLDRGIADLADLHTRFSHYIDDCWYDVDARCLATLLTAHARHAVGIARLLCDRRALGLRGPAPVYLDPIIAGLERKLGHMSHYIDQYGFDPYDPAWRHLVSAYSLSLVYLSRLLRHQHTLQEQSLDEEADEFERDLYAALDHLLDPKGFPKPLGSGSLIRRRADSSRCRFAALPFVIRHPSFVVRHS